LNLSDDGGAVYRAHRAFDFLTGFQAPEISAARALDLQMQGSQRMFTPTAVATEAD
jgi:hypothetical protein